ncbi:Transcription factor Adf-1 [Merluccius polli]|uniref:Transcription factor Adf-1 n=1 Tax=Merluccius polli TaxID=89951 RepID=A0AA47P0S9_MERPO|nr:Transcription factor Adf-1 [Merluccius polli]KAK0154750.1 Transcription factor Adf-1 [Merluccius polli]
MEEKLIVAVTAHPELYDCSCPLYRDRNKKDRAWVSVSEVCGLPVDICRRKWKSLRDTYMRERRKVPKSGAAAGTGRKWKYLGVLSFLDPFITPRQTSGNMGEGVEEDGTPDQSRESVEDEGETAGLSQRGRKKTQKRAREDEDSQHLLIQNLLLETLRARPPQPAPPAPQPPRSEDQLFLDSLAPSLERLEPQVKAFVKFKIHKLIYEASTVVLNLDSAE